MRTNPVPGGVRVTYDPPTLSEEERRAVASLPVSAFLSAAHREGALTKAEAIEAGEGTWPASFAAALADMSAEAEIEARAHWSRVSTVLYTDPMTQLVAGIGASITARTATDLLDAIFGIRPAQD